MRVNRGIRVLDAQVFLKNVPAMIHLDTEADAMVAGTLK
jgi:hypothetical protein